MNNKAELIQQLEAIADEYKNLQNARKELLGFGRTDKRHVVEKAKMIDERLKNLKVQWLKTIAEIDPAYEEIFKRTAPSKKSIIAIKQMIGLE